jgi:Na+-translocating ferredoxin:NAD+ oxidoreductase RNF subunit RnfB
LGFGDCARSCKFDAIHMNEHALPVVNEERCTACGDCVKACPKDLFSLHPASHRLWVACKNHEFGDAAERNCEVACTACGRCALDAPTLIRIENNLAVIDYARAHATQVPIQRCPTGAIVWIEADGAVIKGPAAKKVFRQEALRGLPT